MAIHFLPRLQRVHAGNAIPFGGPQNFGIVAEDVTKVIGRHNIRFGGQATYMQDNRTFGAYEEAVEALGTNTGNSMDNLLNGQLHEFEAAVNPQGQYPGGTVTCQWDRRTSRAATAITSSRSMGRINYKATSRLTLNFGLRWEYFGVQHNKDDRARLEHRVSRDLQRQQLAAIDPGRDGRSDATNPNGGLLAEDYKDFSPRVGFAYALTSDGKTSLRGGYGIGYERNFGNVTFNIIQNRRPMR